MSDSPASPDSDVNSLASLPDSASSDDIDSDDERMEDAEREWNESLQQLELLLTMMVIPYFGKYIGRKCAYWGEWPTFPISGVLRNTLFLRCECKLTCCCLSSMGKIYGVEIPCGGGRHKPQTFQGSWSYRSCCVTMRAFMRQASFSLASRKIPDNQVSLRTNT